MSKISKFFYFAALPAIFLIFSAAHAQIDPVLVSSRRAELEAQLQEYENQIDQYQNLITSKQKEGESLKRDIDIINAEIAQAKVAISARTLSISRISGEIDSQTQNINYLGGEIEKSKTTLSGILQKINNNDQRSFAELALAYGNLAGFFNELESISALQNSLHESLQKFDNLKSQDEIARDNLSTQKQEEMELKALQELQKKTLEQNQNTKKTLLKETKGQESEYQKILKDKQKNAASIRSQLFLLNGSSAISFEKALEYANLAEKTTGIRPAFLLGVITEESNLGQNVGKGGWTVDLAGSRCSKQRDAFLQIASELGLDPNLIPVSKKSWYGYCGGAMGPAQFMPVTWQLFKSRISQITRHNPPSPWDPKDAFIAAALLLGDNGAIAGNYNAEWTAAMKYLAGSNWNKKAYRFYGDDVADLAQKYQEQINLLGGLAER